MTPSVDTIWNFWPLPIFVWTILRVPLNLLFGLIYIFTFIPQALWNFVPEQIGYGVVGWSNWWFLWGTGVANWCIALFTFGLGTIPALIFGAIDWTIYIVVEILRNQMTTIPSIITYWIIFWSFVFVGNLIWIIVVATSSGKK